MEVCAASGFHRARRGDVRLARDACVARRGPAEGARAPSMSIVHLIGDVSSGSLLALAGDHLSVHRFDAATGSFVVDASRTCSVADALGLSGTAVPVAAANVLDTATGLCCLCAAFREADGQYTIGMLDPASHRFVCMARHVLAEPALQHLSLIHI